MEQEPFNLIKTKEAEPAPSASVSTNISPISSFIPSGASEVVEERSENNFLLSREKSALVGVVLGGLSMISWVVILLGGVFSIFGITFSIFGLKSTRMKLARIGLILSVFGLILSLWYIYAAYNGMINYNYFTSEFFGS